MKEWVSIQVEQHKNVGPTIMNYEQQGWRLFAYTTAGMGGVYHYTVNHYLLFVRGE
ncbi:MAG: hypothetical protein FWB84_01360 [Candidatus Bathyarchaeota archaeon]|uniref:hypothetical protein n=1 Tax=Candidatus Bathycorpusculum sp. TaxID=2994959 RepID=UPI00282D6EDA|nr:hypothetical protein [Candidatus Termiticorpusculum sp.]MCL2257192.1 hypothetical protein [Candidatus Termiticorpusculum sp.]MCL2292695.1 hypothetical protein [Candidatus Termiticorpusculum sp.]